MAKTRTSFKKGEVHNPSGRPKREWTWSGELEKALNEVDPESGITYKELVSKSLIKAARKGDSHATKILMDRMDGMPSQPLEHEGEIKQTVIIYKPEKNKQ